MSHCSDYGLSAEDCSYWEQLKRTDFASWPREVKRYVELRVQRPPFPDGHDLDRDLELAARWLKEGRPGS